MDAMTLARDERRELAEFLAGLTPEQWEAPTLCDQWRVRDVVAHVYSYEDIGMTGFLGRLLRSRLDGDRANAVGVAELGQRSPEELVALARTTLQPRGLTAMFGGRIGLTDATIHHQDIRRPLGMPREIPADRLAVVLDFARTAPPIGARKRIRGLTLSATDLDWTRGDGPVVEGPAEALLMALAGRPGVTSELTGPGVATLAGRT